MLQCVLHNFRRTHRRPDEAPVMCLLSATLLLSAPPLPAAAHELITLPTVTTQAFSGELADSTPTNRHNSFYDIADLGIAHERTVDEVLRGEPGIAITKPGAYGLGLLYLRGAGGQGLVTLDGMPVPDAGPGVLNLNALLPDGLQQMEVERGFGSASRPFSSLGGAVRLTSRTAIDTSADFRVEGGTFGFLKETLRGNLAGDDAHLAVTANHSDTFDGAHSAQASNGNAERDPFHGNQALMNAGLDFGASVSWEASLLYRDSWNGLDRYGVRNGALAMVDEAGAFFAEEGWMAQNSLKVHLGADSSTRLQLGYTHTRSHGSLMGLALGYTTDFYLARWENDQRLWQGDGDDALHWVWGAEGRHENASAPAYDPATFAPIAPFAEQRSQQAGFVETRLVHGSVSGDVGVRYEGYDRFRDHALFHAGMAWQVRPDLKLRANGGNGFRIPSYAERLFPVLGNLAIQPERGVGGDLGLEWQALSRLKLSLTGFYSRYDDLIIVTWNPRPSAQIPCIGQCLSNLPDARLAGLEAGGEYAFSEQWRGGAAYTYTDSRNLADGNRVPFRPRDSVRLWGEWRMPVFPATLWAEGVYRGRTYNDVGNSLTVNDSVRVNVQINYRVSPQLDVYLRGENLSNDQTPEAFSFDQPGATVYGGVALKL